MKKIIFVLSAILCVSTDITIAQDKIDNLETFAEVYGYVKYFHPSDEASSIDWNSFAAYGAGEIIKCKSKSEVIQTLNNLFKPIAPTASFSDSKKNYNVNAAIPKNTADYKLTYWQHKGVSKDMNYQNGTYQSIRVNRDSKVDEASGFGNLRMSLDAEKYRGKEIKYTGWVKLKKNSKGTGHLWLRVDKIDKTLGFFNNMDENPITSNEWKPYEIVGEVDANATNIALGCFIKEKGTMYVDDIHLYYKDNAEWIEIPIKNNGFEADSIGEKNEQSEWSGKSKGYTYNVSNTENTEGNRCAVVAYEGILKTIKGDPIFDVSPKEGELIEEEIGNGIFCQIPLSLYANKESTYPKSNKLTTLQNKLKTVNDNPEHLEMRLGNIINAYNVFQHFYPYFDEVGANWEQELKTALKHSFNDKTENDHLITLQKFTAPLKDGHIRVWGKSVVQNVPPINWEWIEGKLVVTEVKDDRLDVKVGDIITKVNGQQPEDHFKEINSRISAGTKGWLAYRAQGLAIFGEKDSELVLEVNNKIISLKRDKNYSYANTDVAIQKNAYKLLDNNIYYLNLDILEMDTITKLMPQLKTAKGIICDMRGYPNSNHGLISHLLKEDDTTKAWMRIPKIIYPNQKKIVGYEDHGWGLKAEKPYLGDKKVVFITDGRAISYAESYMGFIKGYDLAIIVGQPTAGANGNINPFNLLGNYGISWTGMKVFKHDGSQHHAVGVLPDIYVNKTIESVKSGKDEFLDKAIEVIMENKIKG